MERLQPTNGRSATPADTDFGQREDSGEKLTIATPEPASLALLGGTLFGLGCLAGAGARTRKKPDTLRAEAAPGPRPAHPVVPKGSWTPG